ncbi:MAG: transglycosylase SLT domain-containing protein [Candidatus Omnitrophica bacterium]|nr:transglycosylase SLT domain-containing protein [Candidatus Omnitrophota bacterium]
MPTKQTSNVGAWLERETPRIRRALESASRHFDADDNLTVNTLEAVYGRESSFGTLLGTRGSSEAAGHFQFQPDTATRYGLSSSKGNDQRFDIDRASSAAARYLA